MIAKIVYKGTGNKTQGERKMFYGVTNWGSNTYLAGAGLPCYLTQGLMFNNINSGLDPVTKGSLFGFGFNLAQNIGFSTMSQATAARINKNINKSQGDLDSALGSGKLNDAEKAEAQALKEKLAKLQEKFAELTESGLYSPKEMLTELNKLDGEYWQIQDEIIKLRDKIKARIKAEEASSSGRSGGASGADDADGASGADGADDADGGSSTPKTLESEFGILGEPACVDTAGTLLGANVNKGNAKAVTDIMYQKLKGASSWISQPNSYIKQNINKDNVIEVFLQWNQSYARQLISDDNYGLIETIYDEWGTAGDTIRHIISAMSQRLEEYKDVDSNLYQSAKTHLTEAESLTHNMVSCSNCAMNVNAAVIEIAQLMQKSL